MTSKNNPFANPHPPTPAQQPSEPTGLNNAVRDQFTQQHLTPTSLTLARPAATRDHELFNLNDPADGVNSSEQTILGAPADPKLPNRTAAIMTSNSTWAPSDSPSAPVAEPPAQLHTKRPRRSSIKNPNSTNKGTNVRFADGTGNDEEDIAEALIEQSTDYPSEKNEIPGLRKDSMSSDAGRSRASSVETLLNSVEKQGSNQDDKPDDFKNSSSEPKKTTVQQEMAKNLVLNAQIDRRMKNMPRATRKKEENKRKIQILKNKCGMLRRLCYSSFFGLNHSLSFPIRFERQLQILDQIGHSPIEIWLAVS